MKRFLFALVVFSTCLSAPALGAATIKNLGVQADISASGQYNKAYKATFLVDGKIPEANSHQDQGEAWCVPLAAAKEAWVSFAWKKAVDVKSIVYWGRCAWMATENFSACQVYVNGANTPTVNATLVRGPQAQVVTLPTTVKARQIRLVFPANFGGSNPGASEIGLFSAIPSKAQLSNYDSLARVDLGRSDQRDWLRPVRLYPTASDPAVSEPVHPRVHLSPGGTQTRRCHVDRQFQERQAWHEEDPRFIRGSDPGCHAALRRAYHPVQLEKNHDRSVSALQH
ncbi:MAG: discoidin domain-containing protein [Planctomycetes bacterium]|nr:discoidin domain-containing protein [Planctomycetota bacterium]